MRHRVLWLASAVLLALSGCAPTTRPQAPVTLPLGGTGSGTDTDVSGPSPTGCPGGLVPVTLTPPVPAQVKLNVLNSSTTKGLELQVFAELGRRGFTMLSRTDAYRVGRYPGTVVIRFGPRTVSAEWLVASYFGGVTTEFDVNRTDNTLDIILGSAFDGVRTTTEVNQAVAAAGQPKAPPGTCAVTD